MAIGAEGRKKKERGGFVATPAPSGPSVQEAVKAVQAPDGPSQDHVGKGGVPKEHDFDLEYLDSRGRKWMGRFSCHVLSFRERINVGLVKSRLANGASPHQLDISTSNLLEALAHLTIALDNGPDWAQDLEGIHDPGVVIEIYKEVLDHEQRFHETGPGDPGESNDEDEPGSDGADGV